MTGQHLCADHLECFFPCLLHLRGKTEAEIVVKRFEKGCSEKKVVFCPYPELFMSLPKLVK